ncbi:unnamed protein product [Closterium sp. NIES-53]
MSLPLVPSSSPGKLEQLHCNTDLLTHPPPLSLSLSPLPSPLSPPPRFPPSQHNAEQLEELLQEMCTDDDGEVPRVLIDLAVKGGPKVFVVSTLVSVTPATPFVFRNYQYPTVPPTLSISSACACE